MTTAAFTPIPSFITNAITDGYVYECSCGELYNDVGNALSCRKCRNYCVFGYCTHVTDIRDNVVVAGTAPTYEEYEEMRELAEARWAEEKAELDMYIQMREEAGPLYEAELARQTEEARVATAQLAEDVAYAIQDKLMGIRVS